MKTKMFYMCTYLLHNRHVEQKYGLMSFYLSWFNDEGISVFIFMHDYEELLHDGSYILIYIVKSVTFM